MKKKNSSQNINRLGFFGLAASCFITGMLIIRMSLITGWCFSGMGIGFLLAGLITFIKD